MNLTTKQLIPALLVPFIAWRVYRRVRRNIGRQPLRPTRLKISIGLFALVLVLFALGALRHPPVLGALTGGLALSTGVAWYGLKLTRFENLPEGKFYTPNTALGIAISVLFLGRLAYRFLTLDPAAGGAMSVPAQSPLTFFLFGLSAGYFIAYQAGVLIRSRLPACPNA